MRTVKPAIERFMAKVIEINGCWVWQGSISKERGYARFGAGGRAAGTVDAHVWSYKHFNGEIPEGMEIDHKCRNKACVNPMHLEAVTHQENIKRMIPYRKPPRRVTHCGKGHEFTPENTYTDKRGKRHCRACRRVPSGRGAYKTTKGE